MFGTQMYGLCRALLGVAVPGSALPARELLDLAEAPQRFAGLGSRGFNVASWVPFQATSGGFSGGIVQRSWNHAEDEAVSFIGPGAETGSIPVSRTDRNPDLSGVFLMGFLPICGFDVGSCGR